MALRPTVSPKVLKSKIVAIIGQEPSDTKSFGDDIGEKKKKKLYQKGCLRRTLELI